MHTHTHTCTHTLSHTHTHTHTYTNTCACTHTHTHISNNNSVVKLIITIIHCIHSVSLNRFWDSPQYYTGSGVSGGGGVSDDFTYKLLLVYKCSKFYHLIYANSPTRLRKATYMR